LGAEGAAAVVIGNAVVNTALNGGDVVAGVTGAVIGGAAGYAGQYIGGSVGNAAFSGGGFGFDAANQIGSIAGVGSQIGTSAILSGGNLQDALAHGAVAGAISYGVSDYTSGFQMEGVDINRGIGNFVANASFGTLTGANALSGFANPGSGVSQSEGSGTLFDDEGNLMPGASAGVQAQYNNLLEFGLTPAEASASIMGVAPPFEPAGPNPLQVDIPIEPSHADIAVSTAAQPTAGAVDAATSIAQVQQGNIETNAYNESDPNPLFDYPELDNPSDAGKFGDGTIEAASVEDLRNFYRNPNSRISMGDPAVQNEWYQRADAGQSLISSEIPGSVAEVAQAITVGVGISELGGQVKMRGSGYFAQATIDGKDTYIFVTNNHVVNPGENTSIFVQHSGSNLRTEIPMDGALVRTNGSPALIPTALDSNGQPVEFRQGLVNSAPNQDTFLVTVSESTVREAIGASNLAKIPRLVADGASYGQSTFMFGYPSWANISNNTSNQAEYDPTNLVGTRVTTIVAGSGTGSLSEIRGFLDVTSTNPPGGGGNSGGPNLVLTSSGEVQVVGTTARIGNHGAHNVAVLQNSGRLTDDSSAPAGGDMAASIQSFIFSSASGYSSLIKK
jgi:hypothetical protein